MTQSQVKNVSSFLITIHIDYAIAHFKDVHNYATEGMPIKLLYWLKTEWNQFIIYQKRFNRRLQVWAVAVNDISLKIVTSIQPVALNVNNVLHTFKNIEKDEWK